MNRYTLLYILALVITAASQLILKIGARKSIGRGTIRLLLSTYTIGGYLLLLSTTLISLFVMKHIELKDTVYLNPMLFFFIIAGSVLVLKEKVSAKTMIGAVLICVGIITYNLNHIT